MRRTTTPRRSPRSLRLRRGGTTLTEVLMSLMVMGVGLVSVATLFPLSVLRSVQATRQTTATSLRYACEGFIDGSYTPPVWSATPGVYELNPRRPVGDQTYITGCPSAAIALDPDGDGDPQTNDTTYDTSLTPPNAYVSTDERAKNVNDVYVVDPLGYWRLRQQGEGHNAARYFGEFGGVGSAGSGINRFSLNGLNTSIFGFTGTPASFTAGPTSGEVQTNEARARYLTGLPDSFTTLADGNVSEGTVNTAAFPMIDFSANPEADFSMFMTDLDGDGTPDPDPIMLARGQVTFISIDGRRSIVRLLETDTTTTWSTAATDIPAKRLRLKQPLPANFVDPDGDGVPNFDRVIVEGNEDRYSWMFTVRRQPTKSLIDVVVFFNREFGRQDERVYVVSTTDNPNPEEKEHFVAWNSATDPQPEFRKGDWMFDPIHFRWHKIGRVEDPEPFVMPAARANALGASGLVTTDRIVFRLEGAYQSNEPFFPPIQLRGITRGVFMDGVVDVYPINPKSPN